MRLIILPCGLFDPKLFPDNITSVTIWEHPRYFTKYKYNKKKLLLHRASLKAYYDELKKAKYTVKYCRYNKPISIPKSGYVYFDPVDNIKLPPKGTKLESPNFLLTSEHCSEYRLKTDKFHFNGFYTWSKKQLGIIPDIKSQDSKNRKKLPKDYIEKHSCENKSSYIEEAARYVNKHFPNNYGNTDNFSFPVTRSDADIFLKLFIKWKFEKFGDYQDAIDTDSSYLNHSLLSSSINIGLINPLDIWNKIKRLKKIPINSYEGYIRQLFWREYQRYCFIYVDFSGNYFGNKKNLTKSWYNGTLDVLQVDTCIQRAFDTGYLNHIERLMVIGNYMNLSQISPKSGFKWFMEFSIDSYEWVMMQNVLDMVFFVTGGKTMRRPYISSSNYIKKMSRFKSGDWCDKWNKLYNSFLTKNKSKLKTFPYRKVKETVRNAKT